MNFLVPAIPQMMGRVLQPKCSSPCVFDDFANERDKARKEDIAENEVFAFTKVFTHQKECGAGEDCHDKIAHTGLSFAPAECLESVKDPDIFRSGISDAFD